MHAKPEIQGAIAALVDDLTAGLVIMPDVFCARPSRNNLFVGGAKLVPTIYGPRYADAGGLLAYGPNFVDEHRRPASYLDRILTGQMTLPVQTQPSSSLPSISRPPRHSSVSRCPWLDVPAKKFE